MLHTLARRVTVAGEVSFVPALISTHTLARRVTVALDHVRLLLSLFQPTPSHGG